MVLGFIGKIFKYLFSPLRRDANIERKEEKINKKEWNDYFNEYISEKKDAKRNRKATHDDLEIMVINRQIIHFLKSFIASIELYLKDKNHDHVKNAQKNFNYVLSKFSEVEYYLKKSKEIYKDTLESIKKEIKDRIPKLKKELDNEKRLLKKEYINLRRSSKKGNEIDQSKKEEIIKKKQELISKHLGLLEENEVIEQKRFDLSKSIVDTFTKVKTFLFNNFVFF